MINTVSHTVQIPGTNKELTGGLSGPAIKDKAHALIKQVRSKFNVPIIGMGGIMNYHDANDFFNAGADAVSIGTANFIDPRTTITIIGELDRLL